MNKKAWVPVAAMLMAASAMAQGPGGPGGGGPGGGGPGGGGPQGPPPPLGPPPAPPQNPVTPAKVNLGKVLFWDEQLSSTRTVACATCHIPSAGGSDPRSLFGSVRATHPGADGIAGNTDDVVGSPGVPQCEEDGAYTLAEFFGLREQVTARKSPPSINAGYSPSLFWDGRATGEFRDPVTGNVVIPAGAALESQVLGPLLNGVEMAHANRDWADVVARLQEVQPLALSPQIPASLEQWMAGRDYPALFAEAFGTPAISATRIAMAIATYERTQFSNQAPIDNDTPQTPQLTALEQQGRQVFNRSNCNGCHAGNRLTDDQFHFTGVRPQNDDLGRFAITNDPADRGRMKTPGLRNVELHAPYMRNGRFASLEAVVDFYDRGGDFNAPNKDNRIRPLGLTQQEKAALVAFLKRPLTDPRVAQELPPFDRPMLYTESNRVPVVQGQGVAGAGGRVPRIIAIEPPIAGNPAFTIAIANALGGASATLVIDAVDPGADSELPDAPRFAEVPVVLPGVGEGNGWGSVSLPIPAELAGVELFARWYVVDASAPGGIAVSAAARFTVFGDAPIAVGEPNTEGAIDGAEEAEVEGNLEGDTEGAGDGEAPREGENGEGEEQRPRHDADRDGDHRIGLDELLRCIQLYGAGGIQCDDNSEDGFALRRGNMDCQGYAGDYAPQDWRLSLSELLRIVQLYANGGYHECANGEDGYCIGAE